MWTPFVVAVVLVAVSRVEGRPNLDLHDAHAMFPRSLKSFWHLNNRGLAMERLFNGLNVKRPQRAVVAASAHGISQPSTTAPLALGTSADGRPCVCHYLYLSTTYCFGDCDKS
ncbi:hypothetical protein RB195_001793 [Necator americanus]|uniref:Uncharacterized protein n=1 Tax=Necator americanus TaxID=51031 RepID=A0ABR1DFY5_NECAM